MAETYLRMPHVLWDAVVFVADDDVWLTSLRGGAARRLTADRVPAYRPRLSPDGSRVAWASRRDGEPEVHVAPVAGGPPTRLTWWGTAGTRVLGWASDDWVVAASPTGQPFRSHSWAWSLPVAGGAPERLPYGSTSGLAVASTGAVALQSVVGREPATWKRYRGGTAAKLWLDTGGSGTFTRLLAELDGQLSDPVWVGDRLLLVSDHEGHGNVYSVLADGTDLRRHTDHTGAYARDLAGDLTGGGRTAVYAQSGLLWIIEDLAAGSQPRRLDVELPGSRSTRQPFRIPPKLEQVELCLDADGRASAAGFRGTVQWLPHRDGPARALADTAGVRTRLPRVLPGSSRTAVWVTDADGDDAIEVGDGTSSRRLAAGQVGRVLELAVAPDGGSAAVAAHDGRVLRVDLSRGTVTVLATECKDASGLVFSPDSTWLAWSAPSEGELRQLRLAEPATGRLMDATPLRFIDTDPVFTLDGAYLAFLSARTFDPVYDTQGFELSFPVAQRPYLLPLRADRSSPLDPELDGRRVTPVEPGTEEPPVTTRVDAEGLAERVVALPVAAGRYSDLAAAKGGLLWLSRPLAGELGHDRPTSDRRRPKLQRWDLATRCELTLVPELDGYQLSADGTRLAVRDGEALCVVPADREVKDDGPEGDRVQVDLARLTVTVDVGPEWRQMLVETWRLMRDHFWVEDLAGVDWDDVLQRYLPVVDRLATRDDLSELIWEMVGELGASHCYERPPLLPPPPGRAVAFLGADLRLAADGSWEVARVLATDTSVPAARSPLAAAGVDIREGDVLLAVDGRPVGPVGPGPLLVGRADTPVELTVGRSGEPRAVVVVPVPDEMPLRYQDWVAGRRREVHEQSDGRAGYVHVPDMMSAGWAEFHRDLRAELACDALIVDTRENGGGHVSQLVLERLSRRPLGGDVVRHGPDESWPAEAPRGPLVSIANEWAGSDGDIVNQGFKEMGLGLVVGTRTWGGVIGIDGRYSLVDGTGVTQPRYSFWFAGAGWSIENRGVEPDIEVARPPHAWAAGEDPQLAEGLRVLLAALEAYPPLVRPVTASRPDRSIPPLPPRS